MALTEAEELELLELEAAESEATQAPVAEQKPSFMEKVGQVLSKSQEMLPMSPAKASLGVQEAFQKATDVGAENLAETLAGPGIKFDALGPTAARTREEGIVTSPETAAGIGFAASQLPNVAMASSGLQGGFEMGAAGKAIPFLKKGKEAVKKLVTAPGMEETRMSQQAAKEAFKLKSIEDLQAGRKGVKEATEKLVSAEEAANLHFKSSEDFEAAIKDPKRVLKQLESANRLVEKGPEYISQNMTPSSIQSLRKFFQEAEKVSGLSDIAKSEMKVVKGKLVEALSLSTPEITAPLGELAKAKEGVKSLRETLAAKKASMGVENVKQLQEAADVEKKRKVLKALAATGAAAAGLSMFRR